MPTNSMIMGEVLSKRTPNSKTYLNVDGSYTLELYSGPIHFEDDDGNLHNINTDLFDEADFDIIEDSIAKDGAERFRELKQKVTDVKARNGINHELFDYQGLKVPYDCHIPRNFRRGYTIGKGQNRLTFKPVKASPAPGFIADDAKNKIVYQDAWNDTDVELIIDSNGVKENIILKTDRSPVNYSFEVIGPLADDLTAGELIVKPAWLEDAAGTVRDVTQTLRREDDKTYIDLVADVSDLIYPIAIDPTVTLSTASDVAGDAFILSGAPTTNYGNNSELRFGTAYESDYQSFIKFNLPGDFSRASVVSATLSLYNYLRGATNDDPFVYIYPNTGDWNENTLNWNNAPGYITPGVDMKILDFQNFVAKFYDFNVLSILQRWASGELPNYGFRIAALGPTGSFASKEHTTAANRPKLSITYTLAPGAPTVTSPNGGEQWNSQHTIAWTPATDADTAQASLQYQIQLSIDNGATYGDLVALTPVGATSYLYDFLPVAESSLCKIRIRAYDGASYGPWDESNGVFTIEHNQAPSAPTNLNPSSGIYERVQSQRLSWAHNDPNGTDPQSKFDLQWRLQGSGAWNTVTQVTTANYWDAPANTFPVGVIEWQVRTYDQAGLSGPYSTIKTFSIANKPSNVSITSPANNSTVTSANPVLQWSSVGQTHYRVRVLSAADAVLYDSGEIASTNKALTIPYSLANNTTYKLQVAIKDAGGLWSDYVTAIVNVSYTPPSKPIMQLVKDDARGSVSIQLDNSPLRAQPGGTVFVETGVDSAQPYTRLEVQTPAGVQVLEGYDNAFTLPSNVIADSAIGLLLTGNIDENLIKNGDFRNGLTNWGTSNGTASVSGGVATFLASAIYGNLTQILTFSKARIGHKIYIAALVKANSNSVTIVLNDGINEEVATHSGSSKYELLDVIGTVNTGATNLIARLYDNRASGWANINVKKFIAIDLTAKYGASEPTIATCRKLYAKYFEGLQPAKDIRIKSIGRNIFNRDLPRLYGYGIAISTGGVYTSANEDVTDYIKIKPSTSYSFYPAVFGAYYDKDKIFISSIDPSVATSVSPADAYYLRYTIPKTSIDTAQIQEGAQTPYEAYTETEIFLPGNLGKLLNNVADDANLEGVKNVKLVEKTLTASDITALITTEPGVDIVGLSKPIDHVYYNNDSDLSVNSMKTIWLDGVFPGDFGIVTSQTPYGMYHSSVSTVGITVPKGLYANLDAAKSAWAGKKMLYQAKTPTTTAANYEPETSYNDIYRREDGGDFVRIATNVLKDGLFTDYTAKPGASLEYYAIANAVNGTLKAGNTKAEMVNVAFTQIASLSQNKFVTLQRASKLAVNKNIEANKMQFAGRKYQITEFGEGEAREFDYVYLIFNAADLETIEELIDERQTLLLRDSRGRKAYVTIDELSVEETATHWAISLTPDQVHYIEGV